MAKSRKYDMTSEFLDFKSFSGENFSQIEENNFRTKFDLEKSIFWPLTPILTLKMAKSKLCKSELSRIGTAEFDF